jgi:hypothetical protein
MTIQDVIQALADIGWTQYKRCCNGLLTFQHPTNNSITIKVSNNGATMYLYKASMAVKRFELSQLNQVIAEYDK